MMNNSLLCNLSVEAQLMQIALRATYEAIAPDILADKPLPEKLQETVAIREFGEEQ